MGSLVRLYMKEIYRFIQIIKNIRIQTGLRISFTLNLHQRGTSYLSKKKYDNKIFVCF
jgi:hypothetical protein